MHHPVYSYIRQHKSKYNLHLVIHSFNHLIIQSFIHSFNHSFIHSFIHSAVRLTIGSQTLTKRVLQTVRSIASSLNIRYHLFSFRSSSSCLCLLPHLPITFIIPSNFPSITCFRMQFLTLGVTNPVSLPSFYCM